MRRIVTGARLAIRVQGSTPARDILLAVPPIPPGTPREVRVRALEYVLRRQPGLAEAAIQDGQVTAESATFAEVIRLVDGGRSERAA